MNARIKKRRSSFGSTDWSFSAGAPILMAYRHEG